MSTKTINFTRIRIPMLILSVVIILAVTAGTFVNGGFNLGIDFLSGLDMRLQIADEIMKITYTGEERAVIDISDGVMSVELIKDGGLVREKSSFILADYAAAGDLAIAVSEVEGVSFIPTGNMSVPSSALIGLNYATDLTSEGVPLNASNIDAENYADISSVREALESLGNLQIQVVGRAVNQEYIIRMQDQEGERDFSLTGTNAIINLLGGKFGKSNIVVKQTDYVGPRFSQLLGYQAVYLTCFALLLILAYIWFRFRLAYAVSAITALVHDVIIMVGVIGTFQIEVNTATIAALLTIIGYSLNDTIVIFDRIRENADLLRDKDFDRIVNISITQSLSRTLITSLTTLIAVAAIYIFGTGVIKIFALNLIIGVIVGTYSSIFIASPVLQVWVNIVRKRKLLKAGKKYNETHQADEITDDSDTAGKISASADYSEQAGDARPEVQRIDRKTGSGISRKQRRRVPSKK